MYTLIKHRYWWYRCYEDVCDYVRSCPWCQVRAPDRVHEGAKVTQPLSLFDKWFLDSTPLLDEDGLKAVIGARDSLSGWLEARVVRRINGKAVKQFIEEDIICRYGVPLEIVTDIGPENRSEVVNWLKQRGIKRVQISPYHPESNGPIERSMRTMKDALSKMTGGYPEERDNSTRSLRPISPWRPHFLSDVNSRPFHYQCNNWNKPFLLSAWCRTCYSNQVRSSNMEHLTIGSSA